MSLLRSDRCIAIETIAVSTSAGGRSPSMNADSRWTTLSRSPGVQLGGSATGAESSLGDASPFLGEACPESAFVFTSFLPSTKEPLVIGTPVPIGSELRYRWD